MKSRFFAFALRLLLWTILVNQIPVDAFSATCTGADPCHACKNCKYCKHCAKDGGTCGVCKKNSSAKIKFGEARTLALLMATQE